MNHNNSFKDTALKATPYVMIIALILGLSASWQTHKLNQELKSTQTQITTDETNQNTRLNALETNNAQLSSQFQNAQNTLSNLKHLQAINTSLVLTQLQHDLLQGANKNILLNDLTTLKAVSSNITSTSPLIQNLSDSINNLPNINPNQAISQLNLLQQSEASLSFQIPSSSNPNNIDIGNLLQKAWQHFKNLIIIRNNNTIGTQLVSDANRFDAVRQINLLTQEAIWQILSAQDPSATLMQLKITISAYTEANAAQSAWLAQLNTITTSNNFYTDTQIQPVLKTITLLQNQFSLQ